MRARARTRTRFGVRARVRGRSRVRVRVRATVRNTERSAAAIASSNTSTIEKAPQPTARLWLMKRTLGALSSLPRSQLTAEAFARTSKWRRNRCSGAQSALSARATVACAKRRCAITR